MTERSAYWMIAMLKQKINMFGPAGEDPSRLASCGRQLREAETTEYKTQAAD